MLLPSNHEKALLPLGAVSLSNIRSLFLCWAGTWSLYLSEIENHWLKRFALGTDTAMHTYAELQASHLLRSAVEQQPAGRSVGSANKPGNTLYHPASPASAGWYERTAEPIAPFFLAST